MLLVLLQKQGEYKTSGFLIYNNRILQLQPAIASSYSKLRSIQLKAQRQKKRDPKFHITLQKRIMRILQMSIQMSMKQGAVRVCIDHI